MALFLSVEPGDRVRIGDSTITIEAKTGRRTRLRIDSTDDVDHEQVGAADKPAAVKAAEPAPPVPPTPASPPRLTRPMLSVAR